MIVISRLYDTYDAAARAIAELERAGIPEPDMSLIANNAEGWYETRRGTRRIDRDRDGVDDRVEGAEAGAGIGAAVGGIAGLLAGLGLLAIPGIGPVVAAGWLASTAALAAVGGAAGGLIGALTEAGVSRDEAEVYAEGVRRGGTLVTVRCPEADRARCEAILDRAAVDTRTRARMWEEGGWNRFDPNTAPYTADEIRRDRETWRSRI